MNPAARRVLIVEDERAVRELLRLHLSAAGFAVDETGDGREALERARTETFQMIVLDVIVPAIDGITLCRSIRSNSRNRETPILMLTSRGSESDKVLGFESGADDYVTKPFAVREFMARVAAVLRRSHPADEPRAVALHGVTIDPARRTVEVHGQPVDLTRQEFDLVHLLATRPGIVFSRAALVSRVWPGDGSVTERTVDTVVSRIRRKLAIDPRTPELIVTAWGVGYKFADAE